MALADRIRTARKKAGLSQQQLAEQLFVSRQAVTKWESGKGTPDVHNLQRMAALFGVSVDHLLSDDSVAPVGSVVLRQAIDVAALEPHKPTGKPMGSRTHAAVLRVFPEGAVWPLTRSRSNNALREGFEWLLALLFDTPFNLFNTAESLQHLDAHYLVEEAHRSLLVTVTKEAVEARELPQEATGRTFTVGEVTFRRTRRIR